MINAKNKILEVLCRNTKKQELILLDAIKNNPNLSEEERKTYKDSIPFFKKLYPKETAYTYGYRLHRNKQKRNLAPGEVLEKFEERKFNYFDEILTDEQKEEFDNNFNNLYVQLKAASNKTNYYTDFSQIMIDIAGALNNYENAKVKKFFKENRIKDIDFKKLFELRDSSFEQFSDLTKEQDKTEKVPYKRVFANKNMRSRTYFTGAMEHLDGMKMSSDNKVIATFIVNQYNLVAALGYQQKSLSLLNNKDYKNAVILANKITKELVKHSDNKQILLLVDNFEKCVDKIGFKKDTGYINIDRDAIKGFGKKNHVQDIKMYFEDEGFQALYEPKTVNPKAKKMFDKIYNEIGVYIKGEYSDFEKRRMEEENSSPIDYYETRSRAVAVDVEHHYRSELQEFPKAAFYTFVNNKDVKGLGEMFTAKKTNIPKKYRLMINEFAEQNPDINLAEEFSNYEFKLNPMPRTTNYFLKKQVKPILPTEKIDAKKLTKAGKNPGVFIDKLRSDFDSIMSDDKKKIYHERISQAVDIKSFNEKLETKSDIAWKLAIEAYNVFQKGKGRVKYFTSTENSAKIRTALRKLELASKLVYKKELTDEDKKEIIADNPVIDKIINENNAHNGKKSKVISNRQTMINFPDYDNRR